MRDMLAARNLTDLWLLSPKRLLRWVADRLGIGQEGAHEWLCGSLSCRCDIWDD